jgi:excisionase family DNA binding protein
MTADTDEGRRPLTIDEAADALALSPATVKRRIEDGTISTAKIGGALRIPRGEIDRLLAPLTRNDGEHWLRVADAAARLDVDGNAIHRRAHANHLETRRIGDHTCVRLADVERWLDEGLPHPEMEALAAAELVAMPAEWGVFSHSRNDGPSAFVALKPITVGPGAGRQLQVGDVVPAELATDVLYKMAGRGEVAELPLDRGVLAWVRILQLQLALLVANLPELADDLVSRGLVVDSHVASARAHLEEPLMFPVNDAELLLAHETRWIERQRCAQAAPETEA